MANIDSFVMMEQMRRMDTNEFHLVRTDDQRASLKDLNATRSSDYVSHFLQNITN